MVSPMLLGGLLTVGLLCIGAIYCIVSHYAHRKERTWISTMATSCALSVGLLCVLCVPLDAYSVSDPSFLTKEMSAVGIADSGPLEFVRRAYESLFILLLFIILVFVPFAYFYAEESGDDPYAASEGSSKCCTAIKYTAMFEVLVACVLGMLLLLRPGTDISSFHEHELVWVQNWATSVTTHMDSSLRFLIGYLACIGILPWLTFTAPAFAYLPISLLRSREDDDADAAAQFYQETRPLMDAGDVEASARSQARGRGREGEGDGRQAYSARLEAAKSRFAARQKKKGIASRCLEFTVLAPVRLALGIVSAVVSGILWSSLAVGILDAAMNSPGPKQGYMLESPQLEKFNPLDFILVQACRFNLDAIVLSIVVLYLFLVTIAGVRIVGLRCFCLPCVSGMGRVRPHKTWPQVLLMCSVLTAFATVFFLFQLPTFAPQYASFGCQQKPGKHRCSLGSLRQSDNNSSVQPAGCVATVLANEVTATRMSSSFAGIAFFWADVLFVVAVPIVGSIVLAGLELKSEKVEYEDFGDDDDDDDENDRYDGDARSWDPEGNDVFSRYAKPGDWT